MGSKSYNKYFEGYRKDKVYHKNRKGYKNKYVYIGEYYKQAIEDSQWKRLRNRNIPAVVLLLVLYFFALTRNVLSNKELSVGGVAVLVLLPLCILFSGMVYSAFVPRIMTIRQYRQTHDRIMMGSAWSLTLMAAVMAADVFFIISHHSDIKWISELLNLGCYLACTLIILFTRITQSKIQVEKSKHFKE